MSDNAERFKEYRFGADAPDWGPAFWEGYDDGFVNPFDTFAKAWDQFRGIGYGDLHDLHTRLKERAKATGRKRRELDAELSLSEDDQSDTEPHDLAHYLGQVDHPEVRWLSNAERHFRNRAYAAAALARYIEELGPPPAWEELEKEDRENAVKESVHPKTVTCATKAYGMIDEFEGDVNGLIEGVEPRVSGGKRWVDEWLLRQNPYYEGERNRSRAETWKELKDSLDDLAELFPTIKNEHENSASNAPER